jgi:hypothetical protein
VVTKCYCTKFLTSKDNGLLNLLQELHKGKLKVLRKEGFGQCGY